MFYRYNIAWVGGKISSSLGRRQGASMSKLMRICLWNTAEQRVVSYILYIPFLFASCRTNIILIAS